MMNTINNNEIFINLFDTAIMNVEAVETVENSYKKPAEQIELEEALLAINARGINFEQLLSGCNLDLFNDFNEKLCNAINRILHEKNVLALVNSIAATRNTRYDEELSETEYVQIFESMTYSGLYKVLGEHSPNCGMLRIDSFFCNIDNFYKSLRNYICNNIIRDYTKDKKNDTLDSIDKVISNNDGDDNSKTVADTLAASVDVEEEAINNVMGAESEYVKFFLNTLESFAKMNNKFTLLVFIEYAYHSTTASKKIKATDMATLLSTGLTHYDNNIVSLFKSDLTDYASYLGIKNNTISDYLAYTDKDFAKIVSLDCKTLDRQIRKSLNIIKERFDGVYAAA